jgi:hypothetical protein
MPSARFAHASAYDTARSRVLVFGGYDFGPLADLWEWDGTTWTLRPTTTAPSPRTFHAMAWDSARQRLVLFGGVVGQSDDGETWEYDGASWTQRQPTFSPAPTHGHAMAFDAARQRVVLFSGSDTWLFLP